MTAVDTSLLVHAHREDSVWHESAKSALLDLAHSGNPWAIPWPCVHEFITHVTKPGIYEPPTPIAIALAAIDAWTKSPGLRFLQEGPGYLEKLTRLCTVGRVEGGLVHEASIAALCLNHGVKVLWSLDRDFSRFPELKMRNPLV